MQRNASTDELYFVTLTVVDWIDVFTRRYYSDFIIENLVPHVRDQQNANLNIYAYVIMTNPARAGWPTLPMAHWVTYWDALKASRQKSFTR